MKFLIEFLSGLFRGTGHAAPAAEPQPISLSFDEAAEPATLADLPPTLGFVSRQPVYDRSQRIVAYEFAVKESRGGIQSAVQRRNFN